MNGFKHVIMFYTTIIVIILVYLAFVIKRLPTTSIMYRNFVGKFNILENRVKYICIVKLSLTFPLLNIFTDKYFSHWGIGCWDEENNFIEILIGGVRVNDRYVIIYYIPRSAFQKVNVNPSDKTFDYLFVNSDHNQNIINHSEICEVNDNNRFIDVIEEVYKLFVSKPYNLFTNNCHLMTQKIYNHHVSRNNKHHYRTPKPIQYIAAVCKELVDPKIHKYSKTDINQ